MVIAPPRVEEIEGRKAIWRIADHLDAGVAAQVPDVAHMIVHLLYQRGVTTPEAVCDFLLGPPAEHDPYLMPDMAAAVNRIHAAVEARERIAVWGDFDADGLTASAVLLDTFRMLGLEPTVVIPTRDDGHGIKTEKLNELAAAGVTLMVTADCGVGEIAAVSAANGMGMDVIVTDHHQPRADGRLPDALVVCPTIPQSHYPFLRLAGSGVAFKLAQALLQSPERYEPLLDLVALGTIADVVPLLDENRAIVTAGLSRLTATPRRGLRALFRVAGVSTARIDGASVGFYLGPRINAANRMADPRLAFDLITATDGVEADRLAQLLDGFNSSRQEQVQHGLLAVIETAGQPLAVKEAIRDGSHHPLITVCGEWGQGISGLLASELTERYCVPAMVGSPKPDGTISVSARSVRGVNVLAILETACAAHPSAFLDGGGGHAAACGFRTTSAQLDDAFEALGQAARGRVPTDDLVPRIVVDARVNLSQMNKEALETVERLEPYGHSFEAPVFLTQRICLSSRTRTGASGRHLKMTAKSGNAKVGAIIFNSDPELADVPEDRPVDVVFNLVRDEFGGLYRPQINIRDWRVSDGTQPRLRLTAITA